MTKSEENIILIRNWNTQVGEKKDENIVGKYGFGKIKNREEKLIYFYTEHKLVKANTILKNY
jgi:hypothetical protein